MTLDHIDMLLQILTVQKKAHGGEREINFILNEPSGKKTVRITVNEAINTLFDLRKKMLKEEE